jgi:hypothetical protein
VDLVSHLSCESSSLARNWYWFQSSNAKILSHVHIFWKRS